VNFDQAALSARAAKPVQIPLVSHQTTLTKLLRNSGLLIAGVALSLPAFAGTMGDMYKESKRAHPWSITASMGYTNYQDMYRNDGQTPVGRLAFGHDCYAFNQATLGLELGVQNGNTMRFFPSQTAIDTLGGLPIQTTVKPMLDLLVTLKSASLSTMPVYAQLKGGIAYRRWQFNDRDSINDKSQIAGEVQAGLGYAISERASMNLFYQGIYGSSPNFSLNAVAETGRVSNIPVQHGVLLGMTVTV